MAITATTDVDRPAADVFAYATDPTRFSEWQKGVVDGRMQGPTGTEATPRCVTTRRIGFANRASTSELIYCDPPTTWKVRGIDGPIRAAVDVSVTALSVHRSRLTIVIDFAGHGLGRLLVPLVVLREAEKEMPVNLAALKRNLEREQ